ncbi:MAG: hypothetical protein AABX69_04990 [Nanoarchaeota archaeon]
MLSRIKELISGSELKGLVEQLKQAAAAIKWQAEQIKALQQLTEEAKSSISGLRDSNNLMAEEVKKSATAARQLQDELAKTLADLKALSSHIQGSIKQKIAEDLIELTKEVKAKLEGAEKLKSEITTTAAAIANELAKLKADVTKLAAVAEKIKAEDFELVKFSQQLAAADNEKLKLIGRIDTLERLISKMRRQQ